MDQPLYARELDALYGSAREDFVDERDRRVRELKEGGHKEEAEALSDARKPTIPAWAVDQLARRKADAIDELLEAGQHLRDAQRRAASGRGGDALKSATSRVRELVGQLRASTAEIISSTGSSPASHLDDVGRTLFAAAVTPQHHDTLRRGILDRPLAGAGFGAVEGLLVAPSPDGDEQDLDPERTEGDEQARAQEERRRAEERRIAAEQRRLERQRRDLERSQQDQQRRVQRAAKKADQLRARADEAESVHDEAQSELDEIETELATVEDELASLTGRDD